MTKNEVILGGCYMRQNERQWACMKWTWDKLWKAMTAHKVKLTFHYMRWSGIEMR